jgi:cytidylate kinase
LAERTALKKRRLVIAIDGPAASGKSTTAWLVAERLGYLHVDTGAMYRAVTLKVLRAGVAPENRDGVCALMATTHVAMEERGGRLRVTLDGEDVTEAIRHPDVTRAVSAVSSLREVRSAMVRVQRALGKDGGIVLEGRDIGTVVFPDADLKFFMVAGIEARARRRQQELASSGTQLPLETLVREIQKRDAHDSGREESPLRRADDAINIDTSEMTIEAQVENVVRFVQRKLEELKER